MLEIGKEKRREGERDETVFEYMRALNEDLLGELLGAYCTPQS